MWELIMSLYFLDCKTQIKYYILANFWVKILRTHIRLRILNTVLLNFSRFNCVFKTVLLVYIVYTHTYIMNMITLYFVLYVK